MNKSKIIIIALTVVFVVAVGFLGFIAKGKYDQVAEAKQDRDVAARELESVFREKIFPSSKNVTTLRENVENLEEARGMLADKLVSCNVPVLTNVSDSVFVRRLQDVLLKKIKTAPLVEGKKCVSPEFAFGFEKYFGQQAVMPREADVPRLLQQLIIVSSLVDEMYASGVIQIQSIRREAFDGAVAAVDQEDDSAGRKGRRRNRGNDKQVEAQTEVIDGYSIDEELYRAQHFTLHFIARQNSVVGFLNRVAKLKFFTIVSDIKLQKTGADIKVPGARLDGDNDEGNRSGRRGKRSARGDNGDDEEAEDGPAISDLPPGQRLMSGPELDAPLDVTIALDVYDFIKEAE